MSRAETPEALAKSSTWKIATVALFACNTRVPRCQHPPNRKPLQIWQPCHSNAAMSLQALSHSRKIVTINIQEGEPTCARCRRGIPGLGAHRCLPFFLNPDVADSRSRESGRSNRWPT